MLANTSYPLATINANAGGFFPKDGCLCLSAKVRNNYVDADIENDYKGLSQWGPFLNNLHVCIKIGDKSWDGSTWTTGTNIVQVAVTGSESGDAGFPTYYEEGIIKNTNDGRYENANGYVMPLTENLVGKLSITFYSWENNSIPGSIDVNTVFLSDLSLQYYNNLIGKNKGTRVSSLTGKAFNDELEINLFMSSAKGSKKGNGLLFWNNEPIGNLPMFFYKGLLYDGYALPELWLLEKMIEAYTKPAQWLTLEVQYNPSLLMWSLITYDGKTYIIAGIETDYCDEITKLTIVSYT